MSDISENHPKLSAAHETFVVEYLKDNNLVRAALAAGFSSRRARHLLGIESIKAEIERRQAEAVAAKPNKPDVHTLIAEADAAYEIARAAGNATGMVAASQYKAKLTGKLDPEHPGGRDKPVDQMSDEELEAIIADETTRCSQCGNIILLTKSVKQSPVVDERVMPAAMTTDDRSSG